MKKRHFLIIALILVFYLTINLFHLVELPVFADEAIYIRWSQLMIDDWRQYAFFPMNDGKTPLQMWLMIPWLFIFRDPLFAGRFLSVLVGLGNVLVVGLIARHLARPKQQNLSQYLAMLLTSILPATFFYQRMALTDGLLLLNLSLSYLFTLRFIQRRKPQALIGLSLSFALALLSKLSALLFVPSLLVCLLFSQQLNKKPFKIGIYLQVLLALGGALLLFALLKLVPVFPQLFSRGGDFLQPLDFLWSRGFWPNLWANLRYFMQQYQFYLGIPLVILALPLFKQSKLAKNLLISSALAFLLPLAGLGKIIYPRYLLPSYLFMIVSVSLTLANWLKSTQLIKRFLAYVTLILLILKSLAFIYPSYVASDNIPFSPQDREQYLEAWSSGHGIVQSTKLILETKEQHSLAVATEGFFGTLPDGILMYLHRQDVNQLMVEGIGQPVTSIPKSFIDKARAYQQVWLVVNSHRLNMAIGQNHLVAEYCRPNQAPCLQVWDISDLVKN